MLNFNKIAWGIFALSLFPTMLQAQISINKSMPHEVQASGLSSKQAEYVLVKVLKHEKMYIYKKGFGINFLGVDQGFFTFQVTYDTTESEATEVIGSFAVSPKTGAVWEVNLCRQYAFPELEKIQKDIMRHTGKTFSSEKDQVNKLGCGD